MAPGQIEIGCKAPGLCRGEVSCCSEGVRSQAQEASEGKTLTHRADAPPWPLAARVTGIFRQVPDAGYPFLAKEGNLQALLGLGKIDDARKLAAEIIGEAQTRRKLV